MIYNMILNNVNIMITYANLNGDSGVLEYDIHPDYILIQFKKTGIYKYDSINVGIEHFEKMKSLAKQGFGLGTYINENLKDKKVFRINL